MTECELLVVERRLGLLGCREDGVSVAVAQYQPDGRPDLGTIAMVLDHALGEIFFRSRPSASWSLTTELSFDVVAPPTWSTELVYVRPTVRQRDSSGGYVDAEVLDDDGALLAVGGSWARYVPGPADREPFYEPSTHRAGSSSLELARLLEGIGGEVLSDAGGAVARIHDASACANPYGVVHGGVLAALVEAAGSAALRGSEVDLATCHVHLSYVRSATADGSVTAMATREHRGRTSGRSAVVGTDAQGRRCVLGTVTARLR